MWLDSIFATPLIGITIQPSFKMLAKLHETMAPFCDDLYEEFGETSVSSEGPFAISVDTSIGFSYTVKHDTILVRFRYPSVGTGPSGELLRPTDLRPYSALLGDTAQQMGRLCDVLVGNLADHPVRRIGIIAYSRILVEDAAPGISAHLAHFGIPWSKQLIKCKAEILVPLSQTNATEERCHHNFTYEPSESPGELALTLDWQRVFLSKNPQDQPSRTAELIREACSAALLYFEQVGDGSLWR